MIDFSPSSSFRSSAAWSREAPIGVSPTASSASIWEFSASASTGPTSCRVLMSRQSCGVLLPYTTRPRRASSGVSLISCFVASLAASIRVVPEASASASSMEEE